MTLPNRLATVGLWLAILIPLGTASAVMVSSDDSRQAQEQLQQVLDEAKGTTATRTGLGARVTATKRIISDTEQKMVAIAKEKRAVRLRLGALKALLSNTQGS